PPAATRRQPEPTRSRGWAPFVSRIPCPYGPRPGLSVLPQARRPERVAGRGRGVELPALGRSARAVAVLRRLLRARGPRTRHGVDPTRPSPGGVPRREAPARRGDRG